MAFITLRRSRNTSCYYLVESYRDVSGRSRKRTICCLGREQDGTDTLDKAIAHWERIGKAVGREVRSAPTPRRKVLLARANKARQHVELLLRYADEAARVEAERLERQKRLQGEAEARRRRAEEAEHWKAIERLQHSPSPDNAQAAKRAFRTLALRLHPDQGGDHAAFIRLKDVYDRAAERWRRQAG